MLRMSCNNLSNCFHCVKPLRFTPILDAKKRNGPAVHRKPCGMRVCVCVQSDTRQQLIAKALHSCDAYRGVWGLKARQAIRKALIVSDRHSL